MWRSSNAILFLQTTDWRQKMFVKAMKVESKDKVFGWAISLIMIGFFLPLIIGFLTTLCEMPEHFFWQILFSNYILSLILCLPISLAIMFFAIPLYKNKKEKKEKNCGVVNACQKTKIAA